MDVFLVVVLLVLLLYFFRRYLYYRSYVKHMADTLEVKQRYLVEGDDQTLNTKQMLRLTKNINAVILENTQLQQGRAGHLEQLETTLANLFEGVIILDTNNRILMANQALRDSFEDWIGENEIVGLRLEILFSGSKLSSIIGQIKAGEATEPAEVELIQSNERRWVRISGALMKSNSPDSKDLVLLIFSDITRQKELETVRQEFVANVSHELRTPVTIIKGYVDTLVQDFATMPEEQKIIFIQKLEKNADRLNELLASLLTLSKIESTKPGRAWNPLGINGLIREVLANYTDRFAEHEMQLELDLSDSEIEIRANQEYLRQVFENLFLNSLKYTPVRSSLKVGTSLDGDDLSIWIEDNGPGIPNDDLPRIFERFYRVEKGRSREKGGSGLGLSIVKRIITIHGGTIRASNLESDGLRISISLPTGTV